MKKISKEELREMCREVVLDNEGGHITPTEICVIATEMVQNLLLEQLEED